jgi:hypothetical protein
MGPIGVFIHSEILVLSRSLAKRYNWYKNRLNGNVADASFDPGRGDWESGIPGKP